MVQGHLAVGPRQIERAIGHAGALVLFHLGQAASRLSVTPTTRLMTADSWGRQGHGAAQRDDGDRARSRRCWTGAGRCSSRPGWPALPRPTNRPRSVSQEICSLPQDPPSDAAATAVSPPGARAAGAEQGGRRAHEFRLHEEIAEGGMRRVGGGRASTTSA
jgi:hypothetical protein